MCKNGKKAWYNVVGYDTFDIEDMIENAKDDAYLYAYYKDISLPNILHNFTISTEAPQNPAYYYIGKGDEVLLDFEHEAVLKKVKDYGYQLFCDEFNISSREEYNRKLTEQYTWGCVRIKIAAFKKYPTQTRQSFCNLINIIWGHSCWFDDYES